jgi:hypothetical protein
VPFAYLYLCCLLTLAYSTSANAIRFDQTTLFPTGAASLPVSKFFRRLTLFVTSLTLPIPAYHFINVLPCLLSHRRSSASIRLTICSLDPSCRVYISAYYCTSISQTVYCLAMGDHSTSLSRRTIIAYIDIEALVPDVPAMHSNLTVSFSSYLPVTIQSPVPWLVTSFPTPLYLCRMPVVGNL